MAGGTIAHAEPVTVRLAGYLAHRHRRWPGTADRTCSPLAAPRPCTATQGSGLRSLVAAVQQEASCRAAGAADIGASLLEVRWKPAAFQQSGVGGGK